ncbi:AraC family transcriptional regulator [Gracilibacillus saliphilus]|uniref:AraC family transcriptional regulator n=1 Tax=Gracilibacillus saliphilus TaxID=543890 RepID=UPI0013D02657|nr:helix-turn-helix domain-containing protein [Gracilibacillus saliphilus]
MHPRLTHAFTPLQFGADIPIHRGSDFIGIRFRPGALRALFNVSVASYSDLSITLSDIDKVWTDIQYQLTETTDRIALLNTVLLQRLKQTKSAKNSASIANLLHHIYLHQGSIKVQKLAEKEFMSSRHVQRIFLDWIGLSPKTFCRIVRMQYSLRFLYEQHELMGAPTSAEYGYSDQAHFIREFRTYTGMTPSNYMSDFFKTN